MEMISANAESQPMSRGLKFLLILFVSLLAIIYVNCFRWLFGELPAFQITKEGLNIAIFIMAVGIAVLGLASSNVDRPTFAGIVLTFGILSAGVVAYAYRSWVVLFALIFAVVLGSELVKRIRVPYP